MPVNTTEVSPELYQAISDHYKANPPRECTPGEEAFLTTTTQPIMQPTYYVRHPDDSYSVADPQPTKTTLSVVEGPAVTLLRDRVMVRPAQLATKTDFGMIIPDLDKTSPKHGTVVRVGPGTYNPKGDFIPTPCSEGDQVIYAQRDAIIYRHGKEELLIIPASEILLKLN